MMSIKYLKKELRQGYIEQSKGYKRTTMYGIFIGILGFSSYFMLQTLIDTVLNDSMPYLFYDSYFSVLFLYNLFAYLFFIVYFLFNYEYNSFSEISKNKWYALIKMGYKPLIMIFYKIFANILSIIVTYSIGFVTTIFMTAFLKYQFVYVYFIPMYFSGIIDIFIVIFLTMTISLVVKNRGNARYFILGSVLVITFFRYFTGYHSIVTNRSNMRSLTTSLAITDCKYIPVIVLILLICVLSILVYARTKSIMYSINISLPEKIKIKSYIDGTILKTKSEKDAAFYAVMDVLSNVIIVIVIIISLLVNLMVLTVSIATPEREISIGGYIPYVFKSSTMEPKIQMNDLAFFHRIQKYETYDFSVGEIVLFKEEGKVFVEQITTVDDNSLSVDIIHYTQYTDKNALKKTVIKDDVYGVYATRSRWLGAIILFFNSVFGRILFLVIPAVLIFFYKPIINAIKKYNGKH